MNTYKKLLMGLAVIALPVMWFLLMPGRALALTSGDWSTAVFNFVDRSTITAITGNQTVTFTDKDPFDTTLEYVGDDSCSSKIQLSDEFQLVNLGKFPSSVGSDRLHIKANDQNTGCKGIDLTQIINNADQGARTYFKWMDSGTIALIDGSKTFKKVSDTEFDEFGQNNCADRIFVSGNQGTYFELDSGTGDDRSNYSKVASLPTCKVYGVNAVKYAIRPLGGDQGTSSTLQRLAGFAPNIGDTSSAAKPSSGGATGAENSTNSSACGYTAGNGAIDTGLEWIICPIITGLSKAADGMNFFIESQLNFDVRGNLNGQVEKAWAIFKNLVSVIIVIVMLVMVLGQAIGSGVFEAYTIKKILPKLVISVIAMQLSWDICIWVINLVNDLGQGVGQLIAAPFGGMGNLDLPSLVHHLNPAWGDITGVGTTVGAIFLGPTLLYFFWPGLLILAFLVIMSIVLALVTLLARNAIIVIAVMLAPLAILAWVLPGTQKQWQLWKDNFIKALMLFPVVMGLIYSGRVFAWVAGNLGAPGAFDLLMVFAGFFGPYFILPKTFKWGGSALSAASKGINDNWLSKKTRDAGLKGLQGLDKRWQGKLARELYNADDPDLLRRGAVRFGFKRDQEGKLQRRFGFLPGIESAQSDSEQLRKAGVDFTKGADGKLKPRMNKQGQFLNKDGQAVLTPEKDSNGQNTGNFLDRDGHLLHPSGFSGRGLFAGVPVFSGRVAGRVAARHMMPTARGRAQAIIEGANYAKERNDEAAAYAHRRFEIAYEHGYDGYEAEEEDATDENGNVIRDDSGKPLKVVKKDAAGNVIMKPRHWGPGVAAAKQSNVDLTALSPEQDPEGRIQKLAQKELIDTSSWPEIANSRIGVGPNAGKHVWEVPSWAGMIGTSQEAYPKVLNSRMDVAPHIGQYKYRGSEADKAARVGKRAGDVLSDADRFTRTIAEEMNPDNFFTQSQGFWDDALESVLEELHHNKQNGRAIAVDLGRALQGRLQELQSMGPDGQRIIGKLATGGLGQTVDRLLKVSTGDNSASIRSYLEGASPQARQQASQQTTSQQVGTAIAGSPGPIRTGESGEISLRPSGSTIQRSNVQNMSPENAQRWIESRGGAQNISDEDLMIFYNNIKGDLRKTMRDELQKRGWVGPEAAWPRLPGGGPAASRIVPPSPIATPAEATREFQPPPSSGLSPEDFQEGGRFPPPNIPPGPENP